MSTKGKIVVAFVLGAIAFALGQILPNASKYGVDAEGIFWGVMLLLGIALVFAGMISTSNN